MKQKIEWYKEVLEIEPNSKIFLPLARMLFKDGRPDEAIAVLRQGVGRHPDHIEARLFLVELLHSSGKIFDLQQEVDTLTVLFKKYPGFWRAWGERLSDEDNTRDAGLAAIFLAMFLQNPSISWVGVIEQGLRAFACGATPQPSDVPVESYSMTPASPTEADEHPVSPVSMPSIVSSLLSEERLAPDLSPQPLSEDDSDDESEEPITLRTRSMAEVLAEQGDVAGALDIYNELLAAADSDATRQDLQTRIDALSGNEVQTSGDSSQEPKDDKKDWLAVLAQRLEARSLQ